MSTSVEAAKRELVSAARAFRLAREADGADALVRAIDALSPIFATLPTAAATRAANALQAALAAQSRGDWIGLADELEFGVVRALGSGGGVSA